MRTLDELKPAALEVAPWGTALLTAGAGVMLLASAATPTPSERFSSLLHLVPAELINTSHFASSIIGLLLLLLADGLRRKVNAAWVATLSLSAIAGVLALIKGFNWEETAALVALCCVMVPARAAFTRDSRLMKLEITPGWMVSAAAAFGGMLVLALWSFRDIAYSDELWWQLMASADASRALRASTGAALVLLAIGVWRLVATPHTPKVVGDGDPEFHKVRAILASAEDADPEANLALLGDKRFLFSPSGESFLMFGVRGRSWIALGPPVGKRSERMELIWRFRELADLHAARKAVYGVGPDLLPELVELGLTIQKIGESAMVPLEDFSLAGRKREVLRRNWRKAGEAGARFEVIPADAVPAVIDELKAVSDAWLSKHAGGDKAFSMGGFHAAYVEQFPSALVRVDGRIAAFATVWPTADRSIFSMDLMRYSDQAPANIMDFLFVELLLWGKAQGYAAFRLGAAPLAGLDDRRLAPLLSRLGRMVFERGEDFYNFQGVRRYKNKYDPLWEPRYIATKHKWAIPILMADVAFLTSGGVGGIGKRSPRPPKPEASKSAPGLDPGQVGQVDQHQQETDHRQHHQRPVGDHPGAPAGVVGPRAGDAAQ